MATIKAAATGNWSDTATWSGGVLPTENDDVFTNSYTITLDQDAKVKRLANVSGSGITAGGKVQITGTANRELEITDGVKVTDVATTDGLITVNTTGGTATIKSALAGSSSTANVRALVVTAGTVVTTGNVIGGTQSNSYGINNSGTLTVTGNVTGGSSNTAHAINNSGTLTITGNVTAGTSNTSNGVLNNSSSTLTVTGNVTGGGTLNSYGINNSGTLTITGNVTGGTATTTFGINGAAAAASITINGYAEASSASAAVGGITSSLTMNGALKFHASGRNPAGVSPIIAGTDFALVIFDGSGTQVTLASPANTPLQSNVRNGVNFGAGLTGTLKVPAASSVASGVQVDNTTGTAALKLDDVSAVTGAQIAAAMNG